MGGLFLLFTLVPMLELFLLVRIGSVLGAFNTLLLVLVTGFVGAYLARAEGMRVVSQWQSALQQGRVPADGVLSGLLVLVGGVLLITPGIVTDFVGLWLLLPASRRAAARLLRRWMERQIERGHVQVHTHRSGGSPFGQDPFGGPRRGPGEDPRRRRAPRPGRPFRGGDVIDTTGEEVS